MFRKAIIAVAAIATIGATALVPTEASAKGGKYYKRWLVGTAIVLTAAAVTSSCWEYGWYRGYRVKTWVC